MIKCKLDNLLLALFVILGLHQIDCQMQLDEDSQIVRLKAKANTPSNTLIGSLISIESMQPPFYIVPIRPSEPDLFNKDIRIDLETGNVYSNSRLRSGQIYQFSALAINEGLAATVTITIDSPLTTTKTTTTSTTTTTTITTTTKLTYTKTTKKNLFTTQKFETTTATPFIRAKKPISAAKVKQTFRSDQMFLFNTTSTTTTKNTAPEDPTANLTQNVKVLASLLVLSICMLIGVLYATFFLVRTRSNKNHSNHNRHGSFTCTSSTNLTFKQEIENNNKSYLSKFITWFRADTPPSNIIPHPTSTLVSLASNHTNNNNKPEFCQDTLIIRPNHHFTYSDGYLNDMGINVIDALSNEANMICPGIASSRSSNLIDSIGDTPIALLTDRQRFLGTSQVFGLSQWCQMLDWRPDFNLFRPVFDDLSQLGEEKRGSNFL